MNKIKTALSILILLAFCGFFYIGALFVNTDTVLTSEKRKVTPFQMLTSLKKQEIKDFFSRMDLFVADRLLFKDQIFEAVSVMYGNYFFDFDIRNAIKGKDGWYFLGNSFQDVINKHVADIPEVRKETIIHIQQMDRLNRLAKSLNSSFLYVIAPDKHGIYHEYLPDYLARKNAVEHRYAAKAIPMLSEKDILVVDLYDVLKSKKKLGNLYYRTDTHWNMLGASIGFEEIYQKIKIAAPHRKWRNIGEYSLKSMPSVDGDLISIGGFYNVSLKDDDNFALIYKTDSPVIWKIDGKKEIGLLSKGKEINSAKADNPIEMHNPNAMNKIKLVVIGDSFFTALSPFFNASFSDIVYIAHTIPIEDQERVIQKFKPDIVVYETVERYI